MTLTKIPLRTISDARSRIIGQGNLILAKLKELENRLSRLPRTALRKWKEYI